MTNTFYLTIDDVTALGDEFPEVWKAMGIIAKARARATRREETHHYVKALTQMLSDGRLSAETREALMDRIERLLPTIDDPASPDPAAESAE